MRTLVVRFLHSRDDLGKEPRATVGLKLVQELQI